jgi:hypothetical protein
MAKRGFHRPLAKQEEKVQPQEKFVITLDGDKTALSDILKLREILQANRGKTPLEIDVSVGSAPYAKLYCKHSIQVSQELKNNLKTIVSLQQADHTEINSKIGF